ncbi:MAG TPA: hypothetical protein VLA36_17265 [Longimicrobiales bacterium]|nr:hypothetical protein [Longimicrobiales bacterium]
MSPSRRAWTLACVTLALAACDSSSLLGPDAAQGVEGLVLLGPQCPVATPDEPCPDLPYAASIVILDRRQDFVTIVESGADGTFRVGLEPGLYILVPEQGDPFPSAKEQVVEIREGVWSSVTIHYDTGIR